MNILRLSALRVARDSDNFDVPVRTRTRSCIKSQHNTTQHNTTRCSEPWTLDTMDKQPRDHNEKDNDIGDALAIQCKQSVDEDIRSMLSVTPVNVPDAPSGSQDADAPSGSQDKDAFSSSSASSGSRL